MSGEHPTTDGGAGLNFFPYRVRLRPDGSPWKLGSGAMGVTYRADDERLRTEVALKVIAPARLEDSRVRALFLREARAAARVRHENVVAVVYLNDTPGNFFLVMELVAGESLEKWLRAQDVLPPLLATEFALQIARGLGAIHEQQIVHRDLKPANLMVVPAGGTEPARDNPAAWRVKIIDFGLARAFAVTGLETQAGAPTLGFVGTAAYASPEQCAEEEEIDGRADLYALGCIYWEMLTGAPPFRAATQRHLMNLQVSKVPPLARIAYLPPSILKVLARLLEKDPELRFSNAASTAQALEFCRDQIASGAESLDENKLMALSADPLGPPAATSNATAIGASRRFSFVPLLRSAVLIALIAGAWYLGRGLARTTPSESPLISAKKSGDRKTVAVLPFINLSANLENESLAKNLQRDVSASLTQARGLTVVPHDFRIDAAPAGADLRQMAMSLGAGALLEGSVRRAANQVRVTVQLIDPTTGQNLWAAAFDGDLAELPGLPTRIANDVAAALATDADRSSR